MSGHLKACESHFSLIWVTKNGIISPTLGKDKVFTDNSNLTNLVQYLHENGK